MSRLIKNVTTAYIPGDPGNPGVPETIGTAGYWSSEPQENCTSVGQWITPDYNPLTGKGGLPIFLSSGYTCTTTYEPVYHAAVASSPGIPYVAPTAAQIDASLNVGWNSYASSIGKLGAGTYLNYTIKSGTTGAFLAVGYAGMEGSPLSSFTHGLMTDISAIQVFEAGVVVATIAANAPGTQIRIARLPDGRIVYAVDNGVFYISTAPAYLPSEDLYVYGMLYSGYDEVSSAAFVNAYLIAETTATIAGVGLLSARPEQFVEASISGAGSFIASRFTTANINGAGAFSAVVEQATESSIAGSGNFWVYAEASRPTMATIAGVGSLGASPFPTAIIAGIGSLSAFFNQSATISGISHLTSEAYQGRLIESTISGRGKLLAFADASGVGYGELPLFVGIGGDTNYIQGYGTLPLFVSGATNGQSDYVPPKINRGYGNLPFIVGFARAVDIGIGTGSAGLPLFVGVAGDYDYGFASGSLPMFVSAAYSGFIPDDTLVSISQVLAMGSLEAQRDIVMIFTSTGQLASTLTLDRIQALELLSAIQAASTLDILGIYGFSAVSGARVASFQTTSLNNLADLPTNGVVWVVNQETNASSQYEGYGFNSFFTREGVAYGVAADGVYKLEGTTDAGAQINALANIGKLDMATTLKKLMPSAYLGASSTAPLKLEVDADGTVYTYETRSNEDGTFKQHRIDLGRGLKANMLGLTLKNKNGADFEIASVDLLTTTGERRI